MRVAYVGSLVDQARVHEFSGGSVAGNKFQLGLLSGFSAGGVRVDPFLVPPLASFPRGRRLFAWMTDDDVGVPGANVVPFVNVVGLKQASVALGLVVRLLLWGLRTRREPRRLLMVYNAFSFMAGPVLLVKRLTRIPAVAVIADIQPPAAHGLARWEARFQHAALARFDGLVQISQHIAEDFAPNVPSLLIEGGVHTLSRVDDGAPSSYPDHRVLLFSGALDENSGIDRLLAAFSMLEDASLVLRILGKGPRVDEVVRAAAMDPRIDYLGYVDNERALQLQRSADVLVSPRLPDAHTTRYSFPSKLMEYLATGRPVVASRLPGVPPEYEPHLFIPSDETAEAFAVALGTAVAEPYSAARADAQVAFVGGKQWPRRSAEVVRFLDQVESGR